MKIIYKENIILFLDVLGFSNLVYNKDQTKIEDYFSYILSDFKKYLSIRKFKFLIISDSIVVSAKNSKENLSELVFVIGKIQSQLLLKGILVRGAISFGNFHINKSTGIVVGPGLINAYLLEKHAKYPRIILDRNLINIFFDSTSSFLEYMNSGFRNKYGEENANVKFSTTLEDGMPYINYVRKAVRFNRTYSKHNSDKIIKLFTSNYFSNEHFEKYNWLLKEFLEELSIAILEYSEHPEIKILSSRIKKLILLNQFLTAL